MFANILGGFFVIISFAPYLAFLILPFILWYIFRVVPKKFEQHLQAWRDASEALGFQFHEEYEVWTLEGTYNERHVRIDRENTNQTARGAAGKVDVSTRHAMPASDGFALFHAKKKPHVNRIETDAPELQTGDALFDETYVIRGHDPQDTHLLTLFTPEVREAIQSFESIPGSLVIDSKSIHIDLYKEPKTADEFVQYVEDLTTLAATLERAVATYQTHALQNHEHRHEISHTV